MVTGVGDTEYVPIKTDEIRISRKNGKATGSSLCQTARMAAYFIAQYVVKDLDLYREYQKGAGPTIQAAGAELVVFDAAAETIEGNPPGPQTIVLKFEDTAAAKAWYGSEDYQAVVGKRLEATAGFAVISQSMNAG